jgi:hypothetical protein
MRVLQHGKMVATSHPPLTTIMIEHPCELFHIYGLGWSSSCVLGGMEVVCPGGSG